MWRVGERDGDRGKPAGFLPRWDLLCSPSRARAHTDPLALQHPPPQTIIITSVFQAESRATGNGSQTRLRGDEGEEGKEGKEGKVGKT